MADTFVDTLRFPWPDNIPRTLTGLSQISAKGLDKLLRDVEPAEEIRLLHRELIGAIAHSSAVVAQVTNPDAAMRLFTADPTNAAWRNGQAPTAGSLTSLRGRWLTYLLDANRRLIPQPQADGSIRWAKRYTRYFPNVDTLGDTGNAALLVVYGGPAREVTDAEDVIASTARLCGERPVVDVLFHNQQASTEAELVTSLRAGSCHNATAFGDLPFAPTAT